MKTEMEKLSIENPEIAVIYESYPDDIRSRLLRLRRMILAIGNGIDRIGSVEESVKWGEPSYATISGSPVRLGWKKKDPENYALYFHCQTTLVTTFRGLYPNDFRYEGNRAIVFGKNEAFPQEKLERCVLLALTYHRWKDKGVPGPDDAGVRH